MDDRTEEVILVDEQDRQIGTAPKLAAHRHGDLHRAFSVLLHDGAGNMLLQKRHPAKYHSGGLWTNACCGHPRLGEDVHAAAQRRLEEEMGIVCPLSPHGTLIYREAVGDGLIEHELVHIFSGRYRGPVRASAQEVEAHAWLTLQDLRQEVAAAPERFTVWFRRYLDELALVAELEACSQPST